MKTKLISAILLFVSLYCFGQTNLVINQSFEIFSACPDTVYGITDANNWSNPNGYSPDYFNSCDTTQPPYYSFGVPQNAYGTQMAKDGVAYAGIVMATYGILADAREYIQGKLLDTLQAGKSYSVSFFVSLADSALYAVNNIGAYLSATPIAASGGLVMPYQPQVENDPFTNPLTNDSIWTEVSDTFIAQGGEQYITIGNFKDDAHTDTTTHLQNNTTTWTNYGYCYIDDVSVTCLDCHDGIYDASFNSSIKFYPNPFSTYVNIEISNEYINSDLFVYDLLGREVLNLKLSALKTKIERNNLLKGVYLLKIQNDQKNYFHKLIIN